MPDDIKRERFTAAMLACGATDLGDCWEWEGDDFLERLVAHVYAQAQIDALADREERRQDAERLRNAAGIIDVMTSNLNPDHPLRHEAIRGAKSAVADLYELADRMTADAQLAKEEGNG